MSDLLEGWDMYRVPTREEIDAWRADEENGLRGSMTRRRLGEEGCARVHAQREALAAEIARRGCRGPDEFGTVRMLTFDWGPHGYYMTFGKDWSGWLKETVEVDRLFGGPCHFDDEVLTAATRGDLGQGPTVPMLPPKDALH